MVFFFGCAAPENFSEAAMFFLFFAPDDAHRPSEKAACLCCRDSPLEHDWRGESMGSWQDFNSLLDLWASAVFTDGG
jgi:hypothetical protein